MAHGWCMVVSKAIASNASGIAWEVATAVRHRSAERCSARRSSSDQFLISDSSLMARHRTPLLWCNAQACARTMVE